MFRKLLSVNPAQMACMRSRHTRNPKYKDTQIIEGIKYHPNEHLEQVDEPIANPTKLFRVQRIKPTKGRPYWERRTLVELGIGQSKGQVAIIKNIPENNKRLYTVKHLIKVDPIMFPYGEPTETDINHTHLTPTGECIVHKDIAIDPARIEAADKFINDPLRLDKDTLCTDALKKWINPRD